MSLPHLCSIVPTFHDDCPTRTPYCNDCCYPHSKHTPRSDTNLDISRGRYLYQPEPDFCYDAKVAHKSPKTKKPCCSSAKKRKGQTVRAFGKDHKLGPECFLECKKKPTLQGTKEKFSGPRAGFDKSSKEELKQKMEECIKRFDESSPETIHKLEILRNFLNNKIIDEECFPKPEWPHCPAKKGPEAFEVPHPYLPGMTMWCKPQARSNVLKVTVDGRLAEQYRPKKFYYEEPPLNVPPWVLPRYKSQELRGGKLYSGCYCWKKNGMQDDCPRWDCAGRPECRVKPLPVCPPSMNPPICGVRKPNLYHGKPPTCERMAIPPPYPEQKIYSMAHIPAPDAPSVPDPFYDYVA
ncbi:hypothetical protein O3M35_000889 [Rhynocoris fuscipes]|uniref:Uncharacterized protein n=1 Tax=Rhynocoris fuscipes TaxID=488301 RepID=A0AAW1DNA2_9HEMI